MIRYLKKGATEEQVAEVDRKVRQTVEKIIDDVGHRGDAAVRELSVRLDRWEPTSFRLSSGEIDALIASLPAQVSATSRRARPRSRSRKG